MCELFLFHAVQQLSSPLDAHCSFQSSLVDSWSERGRQRRGECRHVVEKGLQLLSCGVSLLGSRTTSQRGIEGRYNHVTLERLKKREGLFKSMYMTVKRWNQVIVCFFFFFLNIEKVPLLRGVFLRQGSDPIEGRVKVSSVYTVLNGSLLHSIRWKSIKGYDVR